MTFEACCQSIDRYLNKIPDGCPRLIDVESPKTLNDFIDHYNVGSNAFLSVPDYSTPDESLRTHDLLQDLRTRKDNLFLTGFTTQWKLEGSKKLKNMLDTMIHTSVAGHVVLFCYQCKNELNFSDPRLGRLVCYTDGTAPQKPKLVFQRADLSIPAGEAAITGIERIAGAVEAMQGGVLYVKTKHTPEFYPRSLYPIQGEANPYESLCRLDSETESLQQALGTEEQWRAALPLMEKYQSWAAIIEEEIGPYRNLDLFLETSQDYEEDRQWLYFIGLKLYGVKNQPCLTYAIEKASHYDELIHGVVRSCFPLSHTDPEFWDRYNSRKSLLQQLDVPDDEVMDFCGIVRSKKKDAIYYLTDLHRLEKEMILETLADYADDYTREEITDALSHVCPDLYAYLLPYRFDKDLLNRYFEEYKYCKVTNRITPELDEIAAEQAVKREYNLLLPARSEKIESVNMERAGAWFMDAMGVEFLGYIVEKCHQKNLSIKITACRSELPSVTYCNKEFLEVFEANNVPCRSVKQIDDIKHHGAENFTLENSPYPTHLIRELEIIDHILNLIKIDIAKEKYDRAILVADHGASRMVILKNKIFELDMHSAGIHGGRMCALTDETTLVDCAAQAGENGEYYVLANHERFKGGKLTGVEIHGGATLEEVTVPIIEIGILPKDVEVIIQTPEVQPAPRKAPVVEFYTTRMLDHIKVRVGDKEYQAKIVDDHTFTIELPRRTRTGVIYSADVYAGESRVAQGLTFTVVSGAFKSNDLL